MTMYPNATKGTLWGTPEEPKGLARRDHPQESHDAAKAIGPGLNALQAKVLGFIQSTATFGATDEECQRALEMNPSTQRPRRIELAKRGLIVKRTRGRVTAAGRKAAVWIAKGTTDV